MAFYQGPLWNLNLLVELSFAKKRNFLLASYKPLSLKIEGLPSTPLYFYFSRNFKPDWCMLSLSFLSLLLLLKWFDFKNYISSKLFLPMAGIISLIVECILIFSLSLRLKILYMVSFRYRCQEEAKIIQEEANTGKFLYFQLLFTHSIFLIRKILEDGGWLDHCGC